MTIQLVPGVGYVDAPVSGTQLVPGGGYAAAASGGGGGSPLTFTPTVSAQTGTQGVAFSWAGAALSSYFNGGTTPYTYAVASGTLPAGLSINSSTGVVSGTPSAAVTASIVFQATDAALAVVSSGSVAFTVAAATPATATTLNGPTGGAVSVASGAFTVGANGTITGTVTVTPSDGSDGTFSPTSVAISSGTPTATFTYTPGSIGAKTISISDTGSLTDAASLTYTVTLTSGTLTSSPLKNNTGTLLTSTACEAFVNNVSTGALVVKKTGLTSHATTGVVTFPDGALVAATAYRVVWRMTSGGAEGLETLTAT